MSTVVVVNASSSGKTSIARAFQKAAPGLFLNFSIDNILYALPSPAIDRTKSGADISDLRLPELVCAFYACVRQLLDLGHDLVIDHAVLEEREPWGDRRPGLAVDQQARIHSSLDYDVRIDTSEVSFDEAARRIIEALARGNETAFARLQGEVWGLRFKNSEFRMKN